MFLLFWYIIFMSSKIKIGVGLEKNQQHNLSCSKSNILFKLSQIIMYMWTKPVFKYKYRQFLKHGSINGGNHVKSLCSASRWSGVRWFMKITFGKVFSFWFEAELWSLSVVPFSLFIMITDRWSFLRSKLQFLKVKKFSYLYWPPFLDFLLKRVPIQGRLSCVVL